MGAVTRRGQARAALDAGPSVLGAGPSFGSMTVAVMGVRKPGSWRGMSGLVNRDREPDAAASLRVGMDGEIRDEDRARRAVGGRESKPQPSIRWR